MQELEYKTSRVFLDDLAQARLSNLLDTGMSSFHRSMALTFSLSGFLIGTEVFGGARNLSYLYGGMFEVCSVINKRLMKLSNIIYMFWTFDVSEKNLTWTGLAVKCVVMDELMYIRRVDVSHNDDTLHAVTPLLTYGVSVDQPQKWPRLASKTIIHVMAGLNGNKVVSARVRVDHRDSASALPIIFRETRKEISVELRRTWLETIRRAGFNRIYMPAGAKIQEI